MILFRYFMIAVVLTLVGCNSGGPVDCASVSGCLTDNDEAQPDHEQNNTDNADGDGGNNNPDAGNNSDADHDSSQVSGLSLRHNSGQTFITWDEPHSSAQYHVYRFTQPINSENLADAELLTERWGPLDADTSRHKYAVTDVPEYFVIEDLGAPLSDTTGLFVHTAAADETAFYAVTAIVNGVENKNVVDGQNAAAVSETVAIPRPVLTLSVNGGKGRLYTQFMDYRKWNPTLNGYAFNYFIALPYNYNPSQSYPLQLELHAYGYYPRLLEEVRYQWQVVQLIPIDPGDELGTYHTWWYGHARDHDYARDGNVPFAGPVENFTEQRVMKAIQETVEMSGININDDLIHANGNSMGASGSVSIGLRYANVISGIYASQPMMNYATSTRFRTNFERLFGSINTNLPIVNGGFYSDAIQRYGEDGDQPTGVWDWMDHHTQVQRRRSNDFAFMMIDFGKADTIIDWQTQGRPTFAAFNNARVAYSATAREGVGHEWRYFDSVNQNLFRFEVGAWNYPTSQSYPALNYASGSGRIDPPSSGDDEYQTNLEWSTPQYGFGQSIVDQNNRYEITVRSTTTVQNVDVTPRNTQNFRPAPGAGCDWTARNVNTNATDTGSVTVDGTGLVVVPQIEVVTDGGTRLTITCE